MKQIFAAFLAMILVLSAVPAAASTDSTEEDPGVFEDISEFVSEQVDTLSNQMGEFAEDASAFAEEMQSKASDAADVVISSVSDAYNMVMDGAGQVIDMASEGADKAAKSVQEALEVIEKSGIAIMDASGKVLNYMDLKEPENMDRARDSVDQIVNRLYDTGVLDDKISREGLRSLADIVFATSVYGYLYANKEITLEDYTSLMSEMIIRQGIPAGVGYVAEKLPIPGSGEIAKEAVSYIINSIYPEADEEALKVSSEESLAAKGDGLPSERNLAASTPESGSEEPLGEQPVSSVQETTEQAPLAFLEDPIENAPLAIVEDPLDDAPMAVLGDPSEYFEQ